MMVKVTYGLTGIYTEKHIEGWRKVTDAVHGAGGYMYIQLMHAGRMSHPDNTPIIDNPLHLRHRARCRNVYCYRYAGYPRTT